MALSVPRLVYSGLRTFFVAPPKGTGGTVSARYCYSVYLRHLIMAAASGLPIDPRTVAEIGPGDSLGIGLTAVLCGAEQYYAFDVVEHASPERNVAVFDELVELLRCRAPIPNDADLAEIKPGLADYAFPSSVLTERRLAATLAEARVAGLRATLPAGGAGGPIRYQVPWLDDTVIRSGTVDMIFSQAVMEHVDALGDAYAACWRWLRPGGFMSHQIDFRCHDTAQEWNGHWAYNDLVWWAIRGARPWLLNRVPYSEHLLLMAQLGFRIVASRPAKGEGGIARARLARRFRGLSADDFATAGAFVQALKPGS
jgi:SAM-dependent methyltransferase